MSTYVNNIYLKNINFICNQDSWLEVYFITIYLDENIQVILIYILHESQYCVYYVKKYHILS